MSKRREQKTMSKWVIFVVAVLGFAAMSSFFIVDQTQQALVTRFGKPVHIISEPGLKFKIPFADEVRLYDKRTLAFYAKEMEAILQDKDRLIVDALVTYRISDPLRYYQAVNNETAFRMTFSSILEDGIKKVLGKETLSTLLSNKRSEVMKRIRDNVDNLAQGKRLASHKSIADADAASDEEKKRESEAVKAASGDAKNNKGLGIEIVDVRIMRTDLPKATSTAIYNRMRSDLQKEAEKFRAEGRKEAQIIRSEADKQRTIILAEADKKAAILRGEGDAEATRIFAESFGRDEEFFEFYRAMEAYKKTLGKEDTTLILSPDSEFLKFLGQ